MSLLERIKKAHQAKSPEILFGDLGTNGQQTDRLKHAFRALAKELHPDHHPDDKRRADAMAMLSALHQLAEERIAAGIYGTAKPVAGVTITSKLIYEDVRPFASGDVCDLYEGTYFDPKAGGKRLAIIKLLRDVRDTDLVDNESRVLTKLWKAPEADIKVFGKYLPRLLETTRLKINGKETRANIMRKTTTRAFTLAEIIAAYPGGVPAEHVAWMWNRMLEVICFLREQDHVHGALTPAHFLIKPDEHGGKLIDFSYAVPLGQTMKALPSDAEKFAPPEIFDKKPTTASVDLYMSAQCAIKLLGGYHVLSELPVRYAGILRACVLSSYARYQEPRYVHRDFQVILRALYGPPKFRPFAMPVSK